MTHKMLEIIQCDILEAEAQYIALCISATALEIAVGDWQRATGTTI